MAAEGWQPAVGRCVNNAMYVPVFTTAAGQKLLRTTHATNPTSKPAKNLYFPKKVWQKYSS
jgi:hypothetical protein